jgi:hypothetical protein
MNIVKSLFVASVLLVPTIVSSQTSDAKKSAVMPSVEAKSTRILVLPAIGAPGESGGRVTAAYDEMKYQFSARGFQVLPDSKTESSIDLTDAKNRTLENFVTIGKNSGSDFVGLIFVEKVKTFAFYEFTQPKIWFRVFGRTPLITPSILFARATGIMIMPNQKYGSTIRTYLIDVKNQKAVLFNHKNFGNSEGFMVGSSKSKWGTNGAVQDAAMFVLSRTLKDYPKIGN